MLLFSLSFIVLSCLSVSVLSLYIHTSAPFNCRAIKTHFREFLFSFFLSFLYFVREIVVRFVLLVIDLIGSRESLSTIERKYVSCLREILVHNLDDEGSVQIDRLETNDREIECTRST